MRAAPAMRIGELARRTGVAVPTLRSWEERYGLLRPVRTSGGHRLYGEDDLERVSATRRLVAAGWSVGAAARQVAREHRPAEAAPPAEETARPDGARLRERLWSAVDEVLRDFELLPSEPAALPAATGAAVRTAVRKGAAGARAQVAPALAGTAADLEALEAALMATRGLLHIHTPRDAIDVLVTLVHRLGGSMVPARLADSRALPIDLSFGEGEPLLPVAEPLSVARLRLEGILPGLVEDARWAVELARRAARGDRQ